MRRSLRSQPVALLLLAILLAAAGACSSSSSSGPPTTFGGNRPVTLQVPPGYDGKSSLPLLVLLHGYGVDGAVEQIYLGLTASNAGMFILAPDGTIDPSGSRFWNATPACCDFYGIQVDDVAYLKGLVSAVEASYRVDPTRVFFFGHSNGGYMSYRMACDNAADTSAMASLAGAMNIDTGACAPTRAVSVLEVHGTSDVEVYYSGTGGTYAYPGAITSVTDWQGYDGCAAGIVSLSSANDLDLVSDLPGAETTVSTFNGCPAGIDVRLWTMQGAGHVPAFTPAFIPALTGWLRSHPRS